MQCESVDHLPDRLVARSAPRTDPGGKQYLRMVGEKGMAECQVILVDTDIDAPPPAAAMQRAEDFRDVHAPVLHLQYMEM